MKINPLRQKLTTKEKLISKCDSYFHPKKIHSIFQNCSQIEVVFYNYRPQTYKDTHHV